MKSWRWFIGVIIITLSLSCSSFYEVNYDFNRNFERGNIEAALYALQSPSKKIAGRDRFLLYVNKGLVYSMLGNYDQSNYFLEKAYLFGEDLQRNYAVEAATFLTNPNITLYRGEDHEHLLLLYYKALNFMKVGAYESALIECRRLNIRLNQLSDKYTSDRKYSRDAFIHNLMGIIYQANKDYNNAFIAYRNAFNIYEEDYKRLFNLEAPRQLKIDLLNSAKRSGLRQEFEFYVSKFEDIDMNSVDDQESSLVFFWHNGLGPYKAEWGINFVVDPNRNGFVVFHNEQMQMNFPFWLGDFSESDKQGLQHMQVFRVAFPKYVERIPLFRKASLQIGQQEFDLELSQDINKIAFYSLEQRMMAEFSKALARAAIKKAAEMRLRKEDEALGAALGLLNAMTEKADTRNWQSLPHSIYYTRLPLKEGINEVSFRISGTERGTQDTYHFQYQVNKGETLFHTFSSLESRLF